MKPETLSMSDRIRLRRSRSMPGGQYPSQAISICQTTEKPQKGEPEGATPAASGRYSDQPCPGDVRWRSDNLSCGLQTALTACPDRYRELSDTQGSTICGEYPGDLRPEAAWAGPVKLETLRLSDRIRLRLFRSMTCIPSVRSTLVRRPQGSERCSYWKRNLIRP